MKTAVLAIVYYEPEWAVQTCPCLATLGYPLYLIDRDGHGSLAEAINRGFRIHFLQAYDFVWIVTNITFPLELPAQLVLFLHKHFDVAAVTPAFESDHPFLCRGPEELRFVPYIEFTAPLVRTEVFRRHPLDEEMPYAGHDIDWGATVRKAGWKLAVTPRLPIGHTYIHQAAKKTTHPVTLERWRRRQAAEQRTKDYLHQKWGSDWKNILQCRY